MEDRDLARLLAWGRIAIGLTGVLMPRLLARLWTGAPQPDFPTNMIVGGSPRPASVGSNNSTSQPGFTTEARSSQPGITCAASRNM